MSNDNLKIIQWNIRNLYSNKFALTTLCTHTNPHVIVLQETWSTSNSKIHIPGYNLISHTPRDSNNCKGGGVAILAANSIPITSIPIQSNLEVCAARIHSSTNPFTLISLYIPPNNNHPNIVNELNDLLANLPPPFLICTDANGHHQSWGSEIDNTRGRIVYDWLNNNNSSILNTGEPTYETHQGNFTHIDLSLSSPNLSPLYEWTVHHENFTSDHFPIIIESHNPNIPKIPLIPKYKIKKANWDLFRRILDIPNVSFSSPNDACDQLEKALKFAADASIPKTEKRPNPKYNKYWWTDECNIALKNKKKAYNRYKNHKGNIDLWIIYKRNKAILRYTINLAKKEAWKSFVNSLTQNTPSQKVWNKVRLLRNRKSNKYTILKVNNTHIHCPTQVAEELAREFCSRGVYSSHFTYPINDDNFSHSNISEYNQNFSYKEINRALKMGTTSTPGPDNLPPDLLRNLNKDQTINLLNIYNYLWNNGLPDNWKESIIIPIHKSNKCPYLSTSYRPISLTNALCKTMERLVNLRLKLYLDKNQLMDPKQSGFRSGFTSLDGIARLENSIRENQFYSRCTIIIFLDISQAFDSIRHDALLYKIQNLEINGNLACFIKKLISNRHIRVRNQNINSSRYNTSIGVPQGSVISPTLFNIYINDLLLNENIPTLDYSKFADDLAIWVSDFDPIQCLQKAQKALMAIENWSKKWNLAFSPNKSKAMYISRKKLPNNDLKLNNVNIEFVNTHKFLGLIIDRSLTWKAHIKHIKQRCESDLRLLTILSAQKWGADFVTLRKLYISLIQSKISYGLFIYNTACKTNFKMLNTIQTTACRIILGSFRTTRREHMLITANIMPLNLLSKMLLCQYTSRIMVNNENPFRKLLLDHKRPLNPRGLQYPQPICTRIETEFNSLPFNYKNLFCYPIYLRHKSFDNEIYSTMHISNKDQLSNISWQQLHQSLLSTYPHHDPIYCDGSVKEERSAYGVWCSKFSFKARLPNNSSIFTCELYAIYTIIKFITTNPGKYLILSDSLSSIIALLSPYNSKHGLVHEIAYLMSNLDPFSVVLEWVPSHMGIPGNEKADKIANEALQLSEITISNLFLPDILKIIKCHYVKTFNKLCNPCHHSTNISIENQNIIPLFLKEPRHLQVPLTRVHLRVTKATHLHIITKSEPNACPDCDEELTLEHVFIYCPSYEPARLALQSYCTNHQIHFTLDDLLNGKFPQELLLNFIKQNNFIKQI